MSTVIQRQFGLSHADLHRILPRFADADLSFAGSDFVLAFADTRHLVISLGPELERRLGLIRIPFVDLKFTFKGWEPSDIDRFMARFDRMFQKGGG